MSDLMKKVFKDKRYQFGYNDAMDIALDKERELQAKIERLTAKIEGLEDVFDSQQLLIAESMNYATDLQAKINKLEGVCAITGIIEREKKYIAAQAKVEELRSYIPRGLLDELDRAALKEKVSDE